MAGLVFLLLYVLSPPPSSTVLLSDVRVHAQTGDVLGTEVTLDLFADKRVVGALRHFEGSCDTETVKLNGTLNGETLSASGKLTGATVRLEGKLTKQQFVGSIVFQLPRQTNAVKVQLSIVKAHKLCR